MARKRGQLIGSLQGLSPWTMIERRPNHRSTGINPVVTILPWLSFWLSIIRSTGINPVVTILPFLLNEPVFQDFFVLRIKRHGLGKLLQSRRPLPVAQIAGDQQEARRFAGRVQPDGRFAVLDGVFPILLLRKQFGEIELVIPNPGVALHQTPPVAYC